MSDTPDDGDLYEPLPRIGVPDEVKASPRLLSGSPAPGRNIRAAIRTIRPST